MVIEINGMAHVILTVSSFEVAREFYRRLLPEFGMKVMFDGDRFFYCVGARTAIGIEPCDPALADERFVQQRGSACTISACEPARVRTWTNVPLCSARWA
jgi:catechol 2,3-dioxygenase-like lactoylglutathione lyase family enzyme